MTSPDEWWACGRCGRVNPVVVLQCSSCERPLGDADRVAVAGLELPGQEWMTLLLAQLWVFFGVAGADGSVDDAEISRLRFRGRKALDQEDPLVVAMRALLREDFWGLVERHGHDRRSVQAGLDDVRRILETHLPSERAARVRVGVIRLGVSVAAASGLRLFGLGRRIQADEAIVLGKMAAVLGLSEEERRTAGLPS